MKNKLTTNLIANTKNNMKVKDLIKILEKCNKNKKITFYYLKKDNLKSCKYETLIETIDNGVEFTIQNHRE